MSVSLGDFLQVTAKSVYFTQECLNVFHYRVASLDEGVGYPEIVDAFQSWWGVNVSPCINPVSVLSSVSILNLTNTLDEYTEAVTVGGTRSGTGLPSFAAWGFRLFRATRLTRHGSKRFVGVNEADTDGNSVTGAGIITALNTLASGLAAGVVITGTLADVELTPFIIGRVLVDGQYVLDTNKANPVSSAQYVRLTTQNSRKAQ